MTTPPPAAAVLALPIPDTADQPALRARLQARLDEKTKPPGALGRLEALAVQLGLVLGSTAPRLRAPQLVVFAADHGLAAQGVSAYPAAVTAQMVATMRAGGAAVSVLARQHGIALHVVDVGVATDLPADAAAGAGATAAAATTPDPAPAVRFHAARLRPGTADSSLQAAMTEAEACAALDTGAAIVRGLPGNVLLLGEMGIGNSSAAALLVARLAGVPVEQATGRGTGLGDAALAHKRSVLARVLQRHAGATAPLQALAAFGGLEIAAMAGALLQAAHERRVVVVDGFIGGAAALVALALRPAARGACVFSHRGAEAGHGALLAALGAEPLLALDLRLGEGSGAALAWPLLVSAERLLAEMATFGSAGVSGPC